ncbi:N-acetylmuramoyl-L-alanine amidase [Candidatus Pseudomonas adelgestsugas]|nr:N-acetylmuramoyl-L-alanine amidase [Candidatus Pseudomonas adelgestsugas]
MRLRAMVVVVWVLLTVMTFSALAVSQVKDVRVWRAPHNMRLVFDLSGPVRYDVFTLISPDRLVVDIHGANLVAPLKVYALNTQIIAMRSFQRAPIDLRVVVDLKKSVTTKSFILAPNAKYGHRLVVDLFDNHAAAVPSALTNTPMPQVKLPLVLPVPTGKRDIIVVIDAGHGGEDPGASSPRGQYEKDVVLAISRKLQHQVNSMKGYRADLTRTSDYFIPLRGRTEIARKKNADLFVSIHADAAPSTAVYGASVFALSDRSATSETSRWLADNENRFDLISGTGNVSLDNKDKMLAGVLLDLSMTASITSSLNVGQKALSNIGRITSLHKRHVEQAGFMVLKSPDIPSILVEAGFISNSYEASKLASVSHQEALARSISNGIRQFFQQNPPPGTYIAWLRDSGKIVIDQLNYHLRSGDTMGHIASSSMTILRSTSNLKTNKLKVDQVLTIRGTELAA